MQRNIVAERVLGLPHEIDLDAGRSFDDVGERLDPALLDDLDRTERAREGVGMGEVRAVGGALDLDQLCAGHRFRHDLGGVGGDARDDLLPRPAKVGTWISSRSTSG